jgi:hypothetical protein
MPSPLYRSKRFWLGLLGLAFLIAAWADSRINGTSLKRYSTSAVLTVGSQGSFVSLVWSQGNYEKPYSKYPQTGYLTSTCPPITTTATVVCAFPVQGRAVARFFYAGVENSLLGDHHTLRRGLDRRSDLTPEKGSKISCRALLGKPGEFLNPTRGDR